MIKIEASRISGSVIFKSELRLEEVGELLSSELLGGAKLGGLEEEIYEEVPAIFCEILGMRVVLSGYSMLDNGAYSMSFFANYKNSSNNSEAVLIHKYLIGLMKSKPIVSKHLELIE